MSNGLLHEPPPKPRLRATHRASSVLFLALALAFAGAAAFHAAAIAWPGIAEPSPDWRHALFVGINLALAAGLLARPRWFAFVFAAFTLQQLYSHGSQGWRVWHLEHRLDWASLIVVVALPPVLVMLWREPARQRRM